MNKVAILIFLLPFILCPSPALSAYGFTLKNANTNTSKDAITVARRRKKTRSLKKMIFKDKKKKEKEDIRARSRFDWSFNNEFELGARVFALAGDDTPGNKTTNIEYFYFKNNGNRDFFDILRQGNLTEVSYDAALRVWAENKFHYEFRELSARVAAPTFSIKAGFQEIEWSETFGFFISDLVNPVDYSDPLNIHSKWRRIPVFTFNGTIPLDYSMNLQLILTPLPRNNRLPEDKSPFNPFVSIPEGATAQSYPDFKTGDAGKKAEFGGKLTWGVYSYLDVGFIFFSHYNRNLLLKTEGTGNDTVVSPVRSRTNSAGINFSYMPEEHSFPSYVSKVKMRGEMVLHLSHPYYNSDTGEISEASYLQMIPGIDIQTTYRWTLGLQYHINSYPGTKLHSIGIRALRDIPSRKLRADIFFFKGINNKDAWIKPVLRWFPFTDLVVSGGLDLIAADSSSSQNDLLTPYRNLDRIFGDIKFLF